MILGNDHIIKWFTGTGNPYWLAYHKTGGIASGQYAFKSSDAENNTNNSAMEELRKWLGLCVDGSEYILVSSPTPKLTSKGYQQELFEVRSNMPHSQQVGMLPAVSGITQDDVTRQISQALASYKREQELNDLKTKVKELTADNKELKRSIDDPMNRVIKAIEPYSGQVIAGIFGKPAQVAGFPQSHAGPEDQPADEVGILEPETALSEEQRDALQNFVTALSTNDPDWVNTLNRMADKINHSPAVIAMLKTVL
ncbi:MAG: hypothetical protein ABIQ88_02385 [Chitinophagaceae bacterium]